MRLYCAEASRRDWLRGLMRAVAAVALGSDAKTAFAAKGKKSQAAVAYRDTPKGNERCEICTSFLPPDSAELSSARSAGRAGATSTPGRSNGSRNGAFGALAGAGESVLRQLSFAPLKIHVRIRSRSQIESCFFPCGMRTSFPAPQSSNVMRLLVPGSPGTIIGPNLVPFIRPA